MIEREKEEIGSVDTVKCHINPRCGKGRQYQKPTYLHDRDFTFRSEYHLLGLITCIGKRTSPRAEGGVEVKNLDGGKLARTAMTCEFDATWRRK